MPDTDRVRDAAPALLEALEAHAAIDAHSAICGSCLRHGYQHCQRRRELAAHATTLRHQALRLVNEP